MEFFLDLVCLRFSMFDYLAGFSTGIINNLLLIFVYYKFLFSDDFFLFLDDFRYYIISFCLSIFDNGIIFILGIFEFFYKMLSFFKSTSYFVS